MIREGAVELEIERHELEAERIEDRAVDDRHAVRRVDDHFQAPGIRRALEKREHMARVGRGDVRRGQRARPGRSRQGVVLDALLEQRNTVITGDRTRPVLAELEPVVLRWIVRRRDLHATRRLQVPDGEIVHRRGREADVDDVEAGRNQPFDRAPSRAARMRAACRARPPRSCPSPGRRRRGRCGTPARSCGRSPRRSRSDRCRGRRTPCKMPAMGPRWSGTAGRRLSAAPAEHGSSEVALTSKCLKRTAIEPCWRRSFRK